VDEIRNAERRKLNADVFVNPKGAHLTIEKVADGNLLLTPKVLVDKEQAYFWTEEWQAGESQADADIAAGRVKDFDSADALIADLDAE